MEFSTILLIAYVVISLAATIWWIYTLIRQAKEEQWFWFVITLLLSPISLLLYWILIWCGVID
jgi:O-antigen/teichoic acid export membrane protein